MSTIVPSAFTPPSLDEAQLRIEALRLAMNTGAVNETQTVQIAGVYLDFLTGNTNRTDS